MPLVDTFAPLRRELDIYQQRALDTRQQAMDAPRQAQQMQLGNLQLQQGQQNLQIGQQTQQLNQIKMQDVQRKQQITQGLQQFMSENPDMPPTKARMTYLQDKDPQAAQATLKETISTATALAQFDPEAATNLINSELGTSYKYRGKDKGFIKVEDKVNGKIHFLDPQSLQAVKTMDIGVEETEPKTQIVDGQLVTISPEGTASASAITGLERDDDPGSKTFQKKISTLLEANPGLSEQEATGMVLGTTKAVTDPVTGTTNIVDMVSGTSRSLNEPEREEPIEPLEPDTDVPASSTLWDDSGLSTGPMSAIKHGASVVSGVVGGPVASQTEQARQRSKISTNELIRALSINPRFPVGEINRIKEEISIGPQILDNPKLLRDRMIAIDESLRKRIKNENRTANDRSMPLDQRKGARRAANDIADFLDVMGVPPRYTADIYESLKPGDSYIDPKGTVRIKGAR